VVGGNELVRPVPVLRLAFQQQEGQAAGAEPVQRLLGEEVAAGHYDRFLDSCRRSGTRAALVHSDHDAIELMRRMRSRGLRTPDDLALIAYDDEIAALADVPLTAVAPAKHELGELAARLLLERLDRQAAGETPPVRQVLVQPRLIVRSSCGASPAVSPP
jgi:DNA-binding LacI/PurR family transcriptional regulator